VQLDLPPDILLQPVEYGAKVFAAHTGRTLYKLAKDSAGASTCKVPILKNGSHTSAECYSMHAKSGLWKPAATGLANGHSVENP
jgi:predicted lipoprotein with Yx(FWY)xxD motif